MSSICLGGTFNPIHNGHMICARYAAEALGYDQVVLIPTHIPPHKLPNSQMAPAADRLAMCRLAAAGSRGFVVDDRELRRPGPSYTIDTVRELKREGWGEVPWLLGADQVLALPKWHEPLALLREAQLIPMTRCGHRLDFAALPPDFGILAERVIEAPAIEISATDIRCRVAAGKPIDFLTPASVSRYIADKGLYQG